MRRAKRFTSDSRWAFAQFGEDYAIWKYFHERGQNAGAFVEFGIGADFSTTGTFLTNTFLLAIHGWRGYWFDMDDDCVKIAKIAKSSAEYHGFRYDIGSMKRTAPRYDIQIERREITPENVNEAVPACDFLSVDTDGNDYHIWKAYTGKPQVVIVEHYPEANKLFPYRRDIYDYLPNQKGAPASALKQLAKEKGYSLLFENQRNCVFRLD